MRLKSFCLVIAVMLFAFAATVSAQTPRTFGARRLLLDDGTNTAAGLAYITDVGGSLAVDNIGALPSVCALLDLQSTTKGFLVPRMTTGQELAICSGTPPEGLLVYNLTTHTLDVYNGLAWGPIAGWTLRGNAIASGGTAPGGSYIGTNNAQDYVIATNGVERSRYIGVAGPTQGFLGLGTATPNRQLEVAGVSGTPSARLGSLSGVPLVAPPLLINDGIVMANTNGDLNKYNTAFVVGTVGWLRTGNTILDGNNIFGTLNDVAIDIRQNNASVMTVGTVAQGSNVGIKAAPTVNWALTVGTVAAGPNNSTLNQGNEQVNGTFNSQGNSTVGTNAGTTNTFGPNATTNSIGNAATTNNFGLAATNNFMGTSGTSTNTILGTTNVNNSGNSATTIGSIANTSPVSIASNNANAITLDVANVANNLVLNNIANGLLATDINFLVLTNPTSGNTRWRTLSSFIIGSEGVDVTYAGGIADAHFGRAATGAGSVPFVSPRFINTAAQILHVTGNVGGAGTDYASFNGATDAVGINALAANTGTTTIGNTTAGGKVQLNATGAGANTIDLNGTTNINTTTYQLTTLGNGSSNRQLTVNGVPNDALSTTIATSGLWDARINGDLYVDGLLRAQNSVVSSLTPGQVVFPDANSQLFGDAQLFWNNASKLLLVGTSTANGVANKLQVTSNDGSTDAHQVIITGSTLTTQMLELGYNTTAGNGTIQSINQGIGATNLLIQPISGANDRTIIGSSAAGNNTRAQVNGVANDLTGAAPYANGPDNGWDLYDQGDAQIAGILKTGTASLIIDGSVVGANNVISGWTNNLTLNAATAGKDVAITTTGGTVVTAKSAGNLDIPVTAGPAIGLGTITQAGVRYIHSFGTSNFFAGAGAGNLTNTAIDNTGVGVTALSGLTSGFGNTAMGVNAGANITSNNYNTAIGTFALQTGVNPIENTAIGAFALQNSTGFDNTGVGLEALLATTAGNNNSGLGRRAGATNTIGNNNTFLGYFSDANANNYNFATAIGSQAIVGQSNSVVLGRVGSDNVGIGIIAPTTTLDVRGATTVVGATNINSNNASTSATNIGSLTNTAAVTIASNKAGAGPAAGAITLDVTGVANNLVFNNIASDAVPTQWLTLTGAGTNQVRVTSIAGTALEGLVYAINGGVGAYRLGSGVGDPANAFLQNRTVSLGGFALNFGAGAPGTTIASINGGTSTIGLNNNAVGTNNIGFAGGTNTINGTTNVNIANANLTTIGNAAAVTGQRLVVNGFIDAAGTENVLSPVWDLSVRGDVGASGMIKSGASLLLDGVTGIRRLISDAALTISTDLGGIGTGGVLTLSTTANGNGITLQTSGNGAGISIGPIGAGNGSVNISSQNGGGVTVATTGAGAIAVGPTGGGDVSVTNGNNKLNLTTTGGLLTIGTTAGTMDISTTGGQLNIHKTGGVNSQLAIGEAGNRVTVGALASANSTIDIRGGISLPTNIRVVNPNYNVIEQDYAIISKDAVAGIVNLPVATAGRIIVIKAAGAGQITVNPAGGVLIDGAVNYIIAGGGNLSRTFAAASDGNWYIIGN